MGHVLKEKDIRRFLLSEHDHNHNHNDPIILVQSDEEQNNDDIDGHHHHHTHDPIVHSVFRKMGSLICFGFIFMMVVEKVSAHRHSHGHSYHHKDRDTESMGLLMEKERDHKASHGHLHDAEGDIMSFMVGLLTHSAVDGIALGAVSAEGNAHSLSLLVFIALMAHKGPAAISMTAFLKRKLDKNNSNTQKNKKTIIKQLIAFSCAAPIFSMLTYFILNSVTYFVESDSKQNEEEGPSQMLGYCLLFSGGTFLYVVTLHIIPEIKEWREQKDSNLDEQQSDAAHDGLRWIDLLILAIGCIVPSLFEHSH